MTSISYVIPELKQNPSLLQIGCQCLISYTTRFQLKVPLPKHVVTKKSDGSLDARRGSLNILIEPLQQQLSGNWNMLQAKIDRLATKICFVQKTPQDGLLCTNLGYLTLEGSGRQTLDTGSTSVVPLNLTGKLVQIGHVEGRWHQLSAHCFDTFSPSVYGNWRKSDFLGQTISEVGSPDHIAKSAIFKI